MGLDMYLYKRTYVQNWAHQLPEQHHKISVKLGGKIRKDIKPERIAYITEQVAYWRKFNALHNWIIENCGKGVDECQEIYVEKEKLVELLDTLKQVNGLIKGTKKHLKILQDSDGKTYDIKDDTEESIKELLPPTSGFFFGSTDIDEYYKEDVANTIEIIEGLLKELKDSEDKGYYIGHFIYQASW